MATERSFPATAMPDRDWWGALWPDPELVLRSLGAKAGMRAVDLCCGDGLFTAPLARMLNGQVHALDIDAELLAMARAEAERQGASLISWICDDAMAIDRLIPEPVDFVLMANTFHGVPDQTSLARAVARVLATDGRFAIVNWQRIPREQTTVLGKPRGPRTDMRMSPDDVASAVAPAGFRTVKVVDLPPYHYGAICGLTLAD